ncbi:MAG: OmpA family protein, partial [Nitrosospira sp.]
MVQFYFAQSGSFLPCAQQRYWAPRSSTVWVNFPENSVNLSLDKEFSKTLVEAAKNAEKIILRGRTDAVVAGSMDGEIARNRALAARSFLVKSGIKANKIRVLSKAAGDLLVPNDTDEG